MGVASIWDRWTDPGTGEIVTSFSMLTVNADGHPVMGKFHRPGDEKRSVVVLEPQQFISWLHPQNVPVQALLQCPPPGLLASEPAPMGQTAVKQAPAQQGLFG